MRAKIWACLVVLLCLASLLTGAEPKPLTEAQRSAVLNSAVQTLKAENAIYQLDVQYREARNRLAAAYEKTLQAEQALIKQIQADNGAAHCDLTDKIEWNCKPDTQKGNK